MIILDSDDDIKILKPTTSYESRPINSSGADEENHASNSRHHVTQCRIVFHRLQKIL